MPALQPVRGTHDLLPEAAWRHRHVCETAHMLAGRFGYLEIATPIFEFTEVFARTLGETSDVVTKEMYSFFVGADGESLTLRPENTAGVARAVLSNGLRQDLPGKYFYAGPMFRYERPQKGRQRQFHQIGVELIGVPGPRGDIEIIALGAACLEALGLGDVTSLELNTLGDTESRAAYRAALVAYFSDHRDRLSEDSQARLERNPLRILDSKDADDRALVAAAPSFAAYLNQRSQDFFAEVRSGLESLGIAYRLNDRLVRGLDYYSHSAFEFVTDQLGAQSAVLAGGRYDGLIEMMGGPATPGVGWAAGVERLALLIVDPPARQRPVAIVPIGAVAEEHALTLAHGLRVDGFTVELGYGGNPSKRLKRANKLNAAAALLLGEDELTRGAATLRDLDSGEQSEIPLATLADGLARYR